VIAGIDKCSQPQLLIFVLLRGVCSYLVLVVLSSSVVMASGYK
jgi:hypothetical protein